MDTKNFENNSKKPSKLLVSPISEGSKTKNPIHLVSIVSGVLASASWGIGTVMSEGVIQFLPPLTLQVVQLAASVTVLWGAVAIQRLSVPLTWKTLRVSLTGFLEPGLTYTLTLVGLKFTTATRASLIIGAIEPILITIGAWILLRERISQTLTVLMGLATTGVVLVLGTRAITDYSSLAGDLLIFLGSFCAALYVVLTRRFVANLSPLVLIALQHSLGLLWALGLWFVELLINGRTTLPSVSLLTWGLAIASGIVQYALSFWLYLIALRGMQANLASLFLTLIPVFGVGGAYLFLGERLTVSQWGGAILILIAVANMSRLKSKN
ncbi:hypothetical protein NIES4071_34450 [Calothrix sp. NIES-4071]|nr:hypothetical protein NIES4071_34450 [Calothrix sp. NIES-4071]BAZ57764.1 hypothetical protein NIES4105_34380 [Calothrix sp. NIES-4105]